MINSSNISNSSNLGGFKQVFVRRPESTKNIVVDLERDRQKEEKGADELSVT